MKILELNRLHKRVSSIREDLRATRVFTLVSVSVAATISILGPFTDSPIEVIHILFLASSSIGLVFWWAMRTNLHKKLSDFERRVGLRDFSEILQGGKWQNLLDISITRSNRMPVSDYIDAVEHILLTTPLMQNNNK